MTNLNSNLHVVARVFLGLLYLVAGLGKLGNVDGFAGYMASGVFLRSLHGLRSYLKSWRVPQSSQGFKLVWRHWLRRHSVSRQRFFITLFLRIRCR